MADDFDDSNENWSNSHGYDDFDRIPPGNIESEIPTCCGFDVPVKNLEHARGSEPMVFALLLANRLMHSRSPRGLRFIDVSLVGIKIDEKDEKIGLVAKDLSSGGLSVSKGLLIGLREETTLQTSMIYLSVKYGADVSGVRQVSPSMVSDAAFIHLSKIVTRLIKVFECPISVSWSLDPSSDLVEGSVMRFKDGSTMESIMGGLTIEIKLLESEQ